MHQLKVLAAAAAAELRENPLAVGELPATRAFADALNAEVSKPGEFDPAPWATVAEAFGERLLGGDDLHLLLWYIAGQASLLAVPLQNQVARSSVVANVVKLCDALAEPPNWNI